MSTCPSRGKSGEPEIPPRTDDLEVRSSAIETERDCLFEKLRTLSKERGAISSAEILKLICEKETDVVRRLDALSFESRTLSEQLMALLDEAGRERDKIMEKSRKVLEESNKLVERI
jgi:hypothetical protein